MQRLISADDKILENLTKLFVKEYLLQIQKRYIRGVISKHAEYENYATYEYEKSIQNSKPLWKIFLNQHINLQAFAKLPYFHQKLFVFSCVRFCLTSKLCGTNVFAILSGSQATTTYQTLSCQFKKLNEVLLLFRDRKKVDLTKHAHAIYMEMIKINEAREEERYKNTSYSKINYLYVIGQPYVESLAFALQFFTDLQPAHILTSERIHQLAILLCDKLFGQRIHMHPEVVYTVNRDYKKEVKKIELEFNFYCRGRSNKAEKTAWMYAELMWKEFKCLDKRINAGIACKAMYEEKANNPKSYFSLFPPDVTDLARKIWQDEANFRDDATVQAKP